MRPVRLVFAALLVLGCGLWLLRRSPPPPAGPDPGGAADHAFAPGAPPRLLEPRPAATDAPVLSWQRLLAADGTAEEDLLALADLVEAYLRSGTDGARRPPAFNEDLAPALTDREALGEAALPPDHPALRDGRLIDRWGTPWQVHPLAADLIELRSAGPDRRLYTDDDLIYPQVSEKQ